LYEDFFIKENIITRFLLYSNNDELTNKFDTYNKVPPPSITELEKTLSDKSFYTPESSTESPAEPILRGLTSLRVLPNYQSPLLQQASAPTPTDALAQKTKEKTKGGNRRTYKAYRRRRRTQKKKNYKRNKNNKTYNKNNKTKKY